MGEFHDFTRGQITWNAGGKKLGVPIDYITWIRIDMPTALTELHWLISFMGLGAFGCVCVCSISTP